MTQSPRPEIVHEALLGEAAECASVAVSVYDDDGRYVAMNKKAEEMLGYERDELLTRDVGDFTAGGIDRTVLLKPEVREGVRLVKRKDGTTVPVAFVVAPTRVASLAFFIAVWWELAPDDPRAATAV
ncbi:MAG TPA: PAS domain-containing protein [Gaiellaceae bacterium]|nr:PAS domain-containing protein [Gaiellaceae bacterium]